MVYDAFNVLRSVSKKIVDALEQGCGYMLLSANCIESSTTLVVVKEFHSFDLVKFTLSLGQRKDDRESVIQQEIRKNDSNAKSVLISNSFANFLVEGNAYALKTLNRLLNSGFFTLVNQYNSINKKNLIYFDFLEFFLGITHISTGNIIIRVNDDHSVKLSVAVKHLSKNRQEFDGISGRLRFLFGDSIDFTIMKEGQSDEDHRSFFAEFTISDLDYFLSCFEELHHNFWNIFIGIEADRLNECLGVDISSCGLHYIDGDYRYIFNCREGDLSKIVDHTFNCDRSFDVCDNDILFSSHQDIINFLKALEIFGDEKYREMLNAATVYLGLNNPSVKLVTDYGYVLSSDNFREVMGLLRQEEDFYSYDGDHSNVSNLYYFPSIEHINRFLFIDAAKTSKDEANITAVREFVNNVIDVDDSVKIQIDYNDMRWCILVQDILIDMNMMNGIEEFIRSFNECEFFGNGYNIECYKDDATLCLIFTGYPLNSKLFNHYINIITQYSFTATKEYHRVEEILLEFISTNNQAAQSSGIVLKLDRGDVVACLSQGLKQNQWFKFFGLFLCEQNAALYIDMFANIPIKISVFCNAHFAISDFYHSRLVPINNVYKCFQLQGVSLQINNNDQVIYIVCDYRVSRDHSAQEIETARLLSGHPYYKNKITLGDSASRYILAVNPLCFDGGDEARNAFNEFLLIIGNMVKYYSQLMRELNPIVSGYHVEIRVDSSNVHWFNFRIKQELNHISSDNDGLNSPEFFALAGDGDHDSLQITPQGDLGIKLDCLRRPESELRDISDMIGCRLPVPRKKMSIRGVILDHPHLVSITFGAFLGAVAVSVSAGLSFKFFDRMRASIITSVTGVGAVLIGVLVIELCYECLNDDKRNQCLRH